MPRKYTTSTKELSDKVGKSSKSITRTLNKLEDSGVVTIVKEGNTKIIQYDKSKLDNLSKFVKLTATDKKLIELIHGNSETTYARKRRSLAEITKENERRAVLEGELLGINNAFISAFGTQYFQTKVSWANTFAKLPEEGRIKEYQIFLINEIWLAYAKAFFVMYKELHAKTGGVKGLSNHPIKDGNSYLVPPYFGSNSHKKAIDTYNTIKSLNQGAIKVSPMAYIYTLMERGFYAHAKYNRKPHITQFTDLVPGLYKVKDRIVKEQDTYIQNGSHELTYYTMGDKRIELLTSLWKEAFDDDWNPTGKSVTVLESVKAVSPITRSYERLYETFLEQLNVLGLTAKEKAVAGDYLLDIVGYANGALSHGTKLSTARAMYNTNVSYNHLRSGVTGRGSKINKELGKDLIDGLVLVQTSISPDIRATNNSMEDVANLWEEIKSGINNIDTRGFHIYQLEATRVGKPTALLMTYPELVELIRKIGTVIPLNEYGFIQQDVVKDIKFSEEELKELHESLETTDSEINIFDNENSFTL